MRFVDFARAHGLEIGDLYPSERIKRCGTTDKIKSTNGAYFYDGRRGWVFNWAEGAEVIWWNDPDAKPWSDDEKAGWKRKRDAAKDRVATEQKNASAAAAKELIGAKPGEHNYLHIKGLGTSLGLVSPDGRLLVPMRDWYTNELLGVQSIWWDEPARKYTKKMTFGMRAKGAALWIGDRHAPEVWLCEGLATGMSIYEAIKSVGLRACVLVTFSANNLVYVAEGLARTAVNRKACVFADNDASGTGETCAKQTGLTYAMSETVGHDANDIHRERGLGALVGMLMLARMAGEGA